MKKLLSILLSASVVLSAFASTLTAFAYSGEDGAYYPDVYNNTLPDDVSKTLGFETDNWFGYDVNSGVSWELTNEDAASGKQSLKVSLPESESPVHGAVHADLGKLSLSSGDYFAASIKASPDFNGAVYVKLGNGALNANWWGETFLACTSGSYYQGNGYLSQTPVSQFAEWNTVNSMFFNCYYTPATNENWTIPKWLASDNTTLQVWVNGTKGTVWIDDITIKSFGEYNGLLTSSNLTGDIGHDGGFETDFVWWRNQSGFNMDQPDKANNISLDSKYVHSGKNSAKLVFKENPTVGTSDVGYNLRGFTVQKSALDLTKAYYLEAWVKLDDFNGNINFAAGNRYARPTFDSKGELWMLGGENVYKSAADIGSDWVLLRSTVIPAEKIAEWVGENDYLQVDLCFRGVGTLYVDDVDFKAVEEDTVTPYTCNWQGQNRFMNLNLATAAASDIYYTTDGTDPRFSRTAVLYNNATPVILTEDTYVLTAALNRATGKFGNVVGSYYYIHSESKNAFNLSLDAASAKTVASEKVSINGNYDYKLSFDLVTNGLNSEVTTKLFLTGHGYQQYTKGGTTYTGAFASQNGYIAKANADGTLNVTYDITDLAGGFDGAILILETEATAGTAAINNVKIETVQKELSGVQAVSEANAPYLNMYYGNEAITKTFNLKNNTVYKQNGTLSYVLTNQDGVEVQSGTLSVNGLAADTEMQTQIALANASAYGVYTLKLTYIDSNNKAVDAGTFVFSRMKNASANSATSTGISSHILQHPEKTADEYAEIFTAYKKTGLKYLRVEIRWTDVEKEAGTIVLPANYEAALSAAKNAGLNVIIVLNSYGNSAYAEAERTAAYANFAKAVKDSLGAYIDYYEVINEPNISGISAEAYAKIVSAVYTAFGNDKSQLIAGNVSNNGGNYLESMVDADRTVLDKFSVWSVHPYAYNWSSDGSYEVVNDSIYNSYFASLKNNYLDGKNIELWCGEFGYPVSNGQYGVDSATSAMYTVRAYLTMQNSGINNFVQYSADGDGTSYNTEWGYGVFETNHKETAVAINAYNSILGGAKLAAVVENGENGRYIYRFDGDKGEVYAVWATAENQTYSFDGNTLTAYDMYGNVIDAENEVALSGAPVYLAIGVEPFNGTVVNGDFETGTAPGNWGAVEISNDAYDGDYSMRINGGTAIFMDADSELVANADVGKNYYLRVKAKASADFNGSLKLKVKSYFGESEKYINEAYYDDTFELYVDSNLTTSWETYTTAVSFPLIGKSVGIEFWTGSAGGYVLIDNVELIPAEESDPHGTVKYDYVDGKKVLTATPANGFVVKSIAVTGNTYTDYAAVPLALERVGGYSKDNAESYTFNDADYLIFGGTDSGRRFINVEFAPIISGGDFETPSGNGKIEHVWYNQNGEDYSTYDSESPANGNYAAKFDFTHSSSETGINFYKFINNDVLSNLDINKRYSFSFKVKATADYNGRVEAIVYSRFDNNGTSIDNKLYPNWDNDKFGLVNQGSSVPTEWTTVTITDSFQLFGDSAYLDIQVRGTAGTLWIDDLTIVPIEQDNTDNHGYITSHYDAAKGGMVITAHADAGYKLDSISIKAKVLNDTYRWQMVDLPVTVVDKPTVQEESISFAFDGYGGGDCRVIANVNDANARFINATFVKADVTLKGDANLDSAVDIKDLVRVKKYSVGQTFDIELVNVDYDSDSKVVASDLASLKRQLLGY